MSASVNRFSLPLQRLFSIFLAIGLLAAVVCPVSAENEPNIELIRVDSQNFPEIEVYFSAFDNTGEPVRDLKAYEVQVQEDKDNAQALTSLTEIEPGLQFITAFNLGPALTYTRYGVNRYQAVSIYLKTWAENLSANTPDDFSLIYNTGTQSAHLATPQDYIDQLEGYSPDLINSKPNITSLLQALDLATESNPNPLMKRVILYITPQIPNEQMASFDGMIARAQQQNVTVFVWLVAPPNVETTNPTVAVPLRTLAESTGGQFFIYSGVETFPDLEKILIPFRYLYQGKFPSAVTTSGSHSLKLEINRSSFKSVHAEQTFQLSVKPPNLIFMSPPYQVGRNWIRPLPESDPLLLPAPIDLHYHVEFPDGHPRDLQAIRLYLDEQLVAEDTRPPFEKISLPLDHFTTSQTGIYYLEVEDKLGLYNRTIDNPLEVQVEVLDVSLWERLTGEKFSFHQLEVIVSLVVVAGLSILFLSISRRNRNPDRPARKDDPLTQPVPATISELMPRTSPAHPPAQAGTRSGKARLIRLAKSGEQMGSGSTYTLPRRDITIGSDPEQAMLVIKSPSVNPLHARISQANNGVYLLSDAGSTTGTWVNYAPVSSQGMHLEHGDIIHFGKVGFRFELEKSAEITHHQGREPK
jgi:hypothetical protein